MYARQRGQFWSQSCQGLAAFLPGRNPALIDSGFVGHAAQTADWVRTRTSQLALVVNTHWHADHVGANGILQARGAGIAASVPGR